MQTKFLQLKRALHAALLVLLLSVVGMGKGYADTNYSFSEVCSSGQTLYYKVDIANNTVTIVPPRIKENGTWKPYWNGFSQPTGNVVIPEQVRGYIVSTIGNGFSDWNHAIGAFQGTEITSVVISNSVTSISANAFAYCSNLASVVFGNSVSSIGDEAFLECSSLSSVIIGNSVTSIGESAFERSSITNLTISNSVTSIGEFAFYDCSSLSTLTMGNSVNSIGYCAFEGCFGLTSVHIDDITKWCEINFANYDSNPLFFGHNLYINNTLVNELDIPESVTSINTYAFYGCNCINSVTIGNSVTSIGENAFVSTNLVEVNFNAINCTNMGSSSNTAFGSSITTLNIGQNVQTIPAYAFKGCSRITSLAIPNSVTEIGANAFSGCSGITNLTLSNSLTNIGASAFSGCSGITNLTIPNSVTSIGASAFFGFNGISITIPKLVTTMGGSAFGSCPRLTTVYYNAENATGSSAFPNCTNLTTIHIGADVREIHPVFGGCSSVHLVVALGPTPAVLESNALTDIAANSILVVSCGKRLTYFSVWNMFAFDNIMEDCGQYPISMNGIGTGGNVTASTTNAQMGEEVQLTVSPNAGMILSSISVCNTSDPSQTIPIFPIGKANSTYGFVMPPFGVSVVATFSAGNSVNECNNFPVSVYPNPTDGQVKIEAEGIKQITISNMLGQVVFEGKAEGDAFEYDFGKHEAGVYLIRIETMNGVSVKKVSVAR